MTLQQRLILMGVIVLAAMLAGLDAKTVPQPRASRKSMPTRCHAGCYLERIDRCKIHVEPFTITVERRPEAGAVPLGGHAGRVSTTIDISARIYPTHCRFQAAPSRPAGGKGFCRPLR